MLGQALSQGMEGFKLSLCLKQRILDLLLVEDEGVKVRSRFKENMEKEKASLYHVVREKKRGEQNNIERLMVGGQDRGSITPCMRRSVTRLAPKVTDTPQVDQLRPKTMLEVDYAVRSRLMTARVTQHTDTNITSGQLCSRKKKNIFFSVHNILSTIEFINQKGMSAALLSFDMDKAFDRCFNLYVCEVLRKMNFSEKFINIIQDMHSGISTCSILHALTDG